MRLSIFEGGITLSELRPMIDLLRDQNILGSNFVVERELIILFSYLFLAYLFSLLTSRLAIICSNLSSSLRVL